MACGHLSAVSVMRPAGDQNQKAWRSCWCLPGPAERRLSRRRRVSGSLGDPPGLASTMPDAARKHSDPKSYTVRSRSSSADSSGQTSAAGKVQPEMKIRRRSILNPFLAAPALSVQILKHAPIHHYLTNVEDREAFCKLFTMGEWRPLQPTRLHSFIRSPAHMHRQRDLRREPRSQLDTQRARGCPNPPSITWRAARWSAEPGGTHPTRRRRRRTRSRTGYRSSPCSAPRIGKSRITRGTTPRPTPPRRGAGELCVGGRDLWRGQRARAGTTDLHLHSDCLSCQCYAARAQV